MQSVARLGDERNGFITDGNVAVFRSADGRYVVLRTGGPPLIFDAGGHYERLLGSQGAGPGEFRSALSLFRMLSDSMAIFDRSTGRVSIFTPDLSFVRSFQINGRVYGGVQLPDGAVVVNANIATRGRAGFPLHRVSLADGEISQSFGAVGGEPPDARARQSPWIPLATDSASVWTAERTRYVLEASTPSGTPTHRLERRTPWFEPYADQEPFGPNTPPRPWVNAIHVDETARLWVLIRVAAPDWHEHLDDIPSLGRLRYQPKTFDGVWDTRIEVIQLPEGIVLASRHVPEYIAGFADSEMHVYGGAELPSGEPIVNVWRLSAAGLPEPHGGRE